MFMFPLQNLARKELTIKYLSGDNKAAMTNVGI